MADLFGPFDQVIHLLASSVCTARDDALVHRIFLCRQRILQQRQKDHGLDKTAIGKLLLYLWRKQRIQSLNRVSLINSTNSFSGQG